MFMDKKETFGQIVRFGIVGTTAAAIHYGVYWLLQHFIEVNIAYTVLFNFFLWLGLSRAVAPLAVLAIAVPANFIMVRFVFKHFKKQ